MSEDAKEAIPAESVDNDNDEKTEVGDEETVDAMEEQDAAPKRRGKKTGKRQRACYKKAPDAPRRFKSAYMFFSTDKHREIREKLRKEGKTEKTTAIAKMVSKAWQDLDPEERSRYENMARQDKARYEIEKSLYSGPWKVLKTKGTRKDPKAPKRPMSTFLSFSRDKRRQVMEKNPKMSNAEVSRTLAQMWKEASDEVKQEYVEKEQELRKQYLQEAADFRENHRKQIAQKRQQREEIALQHVAMLDAVVSSKEDDVGEDEDVIKKRPLKKRARESASGLPTALETLAESAKADGFKADDITSTRKAAPGSDVAALLARERERVGDLSTEELLAAERILAEKRLLQSRSSEASLLQSLLGADSSLAARTLGARLRGFGGGADMSSLLALQARPFLENGALLAGGAGLGLGAQTDSQLGLLDADYAFANVLGASRALPPLPSTSPASLLLRQRAAAPATLTPASLLARNLLGDADLLGSSDLLTTSNLLVGARRAAQTQPQPLVAESSAAALAGRIAEQEQEQLLAGQLMNEERDLVAAALRLQAARRSSILGRVDHESNGGV